MMVIKDVLRPKHPEAEITPSSLAFVVYERLAVPLSEVSARQHCARVGSAHLQ